MPTDAIITSNLKPPIAVLRLVTHSSNKMVPSNTKNSTSVCPRIVQKVLGVVGLEVKEDGVIGHVCNTYTLEAVLGRSP